MKGHAKLRSFWAHSEKRALVVEERRLEDEDAHNHAHERALPRMTFQGLYERQERQKSCLEQELCLKWGVLAPKGLRHWLLPAFSAKLLLPAAKMTRSPAAVGPSPISRPKPTSNLSGAQR